MGAALLRLIELHAALLVSAANRRRAPTFQNLIRESPTRTLLGIRPDRSHRQSVPLPLMPNSTITVADLTKASSGNELKSRRSMPLSKYITWVTLPCLARTRVIRDHLRMLGGCLNGSFGAHLLDHPGVNLRLKPDISRSNLYWGGKEPSLDLCVDARLFERRLLFNVMCR